MIDNLTFEEFEDWKRYSAAAICAGYIEHEESGRYGHSAIADNAIIEQRKRQPVETVAYNEAFKQGHDAGYALAMKQYKQYDGWEYAPNCSDLRRKRNEYKSFYYEYASISGDRVYPCGCSLKEALENNWERRPEGI